MSNKKAVIAGTLLILACAGLFGFIQFQKRAKIADIISGEAEWDLRDAALKPLPVQIDVNNLADGIYPAAFHQEDISKEEGGYSVPFEVFNMDLYDAVELQQMEVGGYIEIDGELVKIESLSKTGSVIINGGLEEGGALLIPIGGGVYRYQGWDDIATYSSLGKVTLFVSETIDFADRGNVEESMEGVLVPGVKVYDYLKNIRFGSFDQHSVKIRIEDGKVVEFFREYRP